MSRAFSDQALVLWSQLPGWVQEVGPVSVFKLPFFRLRVKANTVMLQ